MKKLRSIIFILTLLSSASHADIYVIVNQDNPVQSLSKKETIDIFMGKTKVFRHGVTIQTIDQPNKSQARADFYKTLTGKSVAYVNAYWARLFYTGRNKPPADNFKSDNEIIFEVSKNPKAIAYVLANDAPQGVKIVMHIPD